jgi:hypothetical protein
MLHYYCQCDNGIHISYLGREIYVQEKYINNKLNIFNSMCGTLKEL